MPVTKKPLYGGLSNLAERGGFEPPRRYKRLPDFESGTFNRSATSPDFHGRRAAAGGAMIRAAGSADKARAVHCRPFFQSRSEEHTSELQSLMRTSYAVFCLNKTHNTSLLYKSSST